MSFVALKMDVVGSRKVKERAKLQELMMQTVKQANGRFASALQSKLVITHGDEVQGLFYARYAGDVFPLIEFWMDELRPHRLRFGLGVGELSTPVQEYAIGMDGTAWHRAEKAIETARRQHLFIEMCGLGKEADARIAAMANLLLFLRHRWSDSQLEAVRLLEELGTQSEAAARLRVTPAAVSQRLKGAGWPYYRAGRDELMHLLQEECLRSK